MFALFKVAEADGNLDMQSQSMAGSFLADISFVNDFELTAITAHKLAELTVKDGKLLAGFQIGERREIFGYFVGHFADGRCVIWITAVSVISSCPLPTTEWTETEDSVNGRHPHVETVAGDLTVKIEDNTVMPLGFTARALKIKPVTR